MSKKNIRVGNTLVGHSQPCYIVAEIGINHNGSLDTAKEFISQKRAHEIFNQTQENYNLYAYSLLRDGQFLDTLGKKSIAKPKFSS